MVRWIVLVGVVATTGTAIASPGPGSIVRGEVTAAASRWTADGSRIVTEAIVRAPDGTLTAVSQLGGHVGDLTMRTLPGPALIAPGMEVELVVREAHSLAGVRSLAVEDVVVIHDEFVRTGPTPGGEYLRWKSGCAKLGIAAEGTRAVAGDTERAVFDSVLAEWNDNVAACSYMNVVSEGPLADQEVGTDRINVLKFRDVTWCRPAIDDDPARCYSPQSAGITTVVYVDDPGNPRDGEIVDADIELNGVDFAISVEGVTLDDGSCLADLANTLTHEVGHLLGIEHTCRVAGDPPRVDDQGNDVPLCSATSDPLITEATMYNFQSCGETKKQSLSPDDIDAICGTYPIADDPQECLSPDESTGCCDAGTDPRAPVALTVLVALSLIRRRS
jgi:hypothetical protein